MYKSLIREGSMKPGSMKPGSKLGSFRMVTCNFLFDIVVTKFDSPYVKIGDLKSLEIVVKFNKKAVNITASRINVSDFKLGSSTEITVFPKILRQNLDECGMPVTVKYRGRTLGTAQINFPESFINTIAEGMPDLIHVDSCTFERDGKIAGTIDVLCRLLIKCDDQSKPWEVDCQRNMHKSIHPQDIMFLISESQQCPSPCDPCLDALEPEEGDERLKLDLDRYRGFNDADLMPENTFTHNPAGNTACCEIKKLTEEYEHIIDSLVKRVGQPEPLKLPCRTAEELRSPCGGPCQYPKPENRPNPPTGASVSYLPTSQRISVPISDKDQPILFCPVCLTNMSWLPKLASCPKCGVKTAQVVETPQKQLAAEEILIDYLGKPPATTDDYCVDPCDSADKGKTIERKQSGCSCKHGKLCAYCRVRKQCLDILPKDNKQSSEVPGKKTQSSDDYCAINTDLGQSRPFLASVFSELRDLYNLKHIKQADIKKQSYQKSANKTTRESCRKTATTIEERRKLAEQKRRISGAHRFCLSRMGPVSRRHGWDWSSSREARMYGWRPGAILKPMKKLMTFFLHCSAEHNAYNVCRKQNEIEWEQIRQLPILNICKRNGDILITLRAINNTNVMMKPIVFKLVKSDLAVALSDIKRKFKAKGFRKCTCHQTLMMCVCRNNQEKKQLEYVLQKECKRRGMENCVDHLVFTDTSESEMEFDFDVTPPAGVPQPQPLPRLKPCTVNHNTQTVVKDLNVSPRYPIEYGPSWRTYDCAAGDRYTHTAFGIPGETVFEDGVFAYSGGGPHGVSANPRGKVKNKDIWGDRHGGPMRGGGRTVPMGRPGGKTFPGAKKKPGTVSEPIPVRMTKRYYKALADAAKAAKAEKMEREKKNKGTDMMKYMMKSGVIATPWNPNANA